MGQVSEASRDLRFSYRNHRGELHEYVIAPPLQNLINGGRSYAVTWDKERGWMLSGDVVTRDGDPRPGMEPTRRRSFKLCDIKFLHEVEAE